MSSEKEPPTTPYGGDIPFLVGNMLVVWIDKPGNQRFSSIQEAYRMWLWAEGFDELGDNYTDAVAVILVFLSKAIADPEYQRYYTAAGSENDETIPHTVLAPEIMSTDQPTHWEFLTEENYHRMYREWRSRQPRH